MKKLFLSIFLGVMIYFAQSSQINAYSYPLRELGNCRDQKECYTYCEVPQNHAACWSYKVYSPQVLAEETSETKLLKLGITFPIWELNNCADIAECKIFCNQTENNNVCRQYALKVGITNKEKVISIAKEELGCTTLSECKNFCSQSANKDACEAFAKRFHLKAEVKDRLIEKARTELGCTTKDQCKELCQKPENRARCQSISQQLDSDKVQKREQLIERAKENLGCTSFESCRTYCQDPQNHDKCRNFGISVRKNEATDKVKERLGCTTPQECRKECDEHPEKCPNFPKKPFPGNLPNGKLNPTGIRPFENRGQGSRNQGPGTFMERKPESSQINNSGDDLDDNDEDEFEIEDENEFEDEIQSPNSGSGTRNN